MPERLIFTFLGVRSDLEAFLADVILHMGSRDRLGDKISLWIDLASCPPVGPKIPPHVYRHVSDLWQKDPKDEGK